MEFGFTEQQLTLHETVRRVLERECTTADLRALAEGGDGRSAARWEVLSTLGAPGLLVPEIHDGLGLGDVEMVGVLEAAGWAALPEPLAESASIAAPILRAARREQWLRSIASGARVATVGGVEFADTGLATTTEPASSAGSVLTHRVPGAGRADVFVFACEVPRSGWQVHAAEAEGVTVAVTPSIDPTRDLGTVEWRPRPHTLLASGDAAMSLVEEMADRSALGAAAQLLGLADRMITMAADHARERHQFGRPIGSFQAVKHLLANARVGLEFARPATYRAADSVARALPDQSEHVSMAKVLASDAANLAARVALQVHGAIGYTWECDLHLFMKRAWALSAASGSASLHRSRVLGAAVARSGAD